uniref:Uncharacterized protein n=1 Tax=Arundo donax TaxID=35708 RepID=A0A0A8XXI1_ARUDO
MSIFTACITQSKLHLTS